MVSQEEQPEAVENYQRTSRGLLLKAEQALEEGDLLQSSEKFWGAAAHMVKALAQRRGWRHSSHAALFGVMDQVVLETSDEGLRGLFLEAGQLHTNFYENWLSLETVRYGGERVRELLDRLEQLL